MSESMPNTSVALPPSCTSLNSFDILENENKSIVAERSCSCYTDLCNSAENDVKLPKLITGDVECISKRCKSDGCTNTGNGGTCKGQYCILGN